MNSDIVRNLFNYDQHTGVLTWFNPVSNRQKKGGVAGCIHHNGYIRISYKRKLYLAHRLIWLYMTREWPKDHVDHINHDRSDNRWVNLREATRKENQKNLKIGKDNKSGVVGVCWHKRKNKWEVHISRISLGAFVDKFEAICARKSAEVKYCYHPNHGK